MHPALYTSMKCKLYPYTRKEVVTTQEIKQISGWQITAFNIPDTWAYSKGDNVRIAVIDTGCDLDHPDLKENLLEGHNFINPSQLPQDDNDHGTHVTGSICATNNGLGVVGIAPKAKVMPLKVLDKDGSGSMELAAKAVRYAVEMDVDMMCMSMASGRPLASLRKAIKIATNKGIPVFCAGGNVNKTMDILYPARYPETIAIAALDKNFSRAAFSNTSKHNLDFLAPGVDILSTVRGGWYSVFSGSSMAAPFAVGVAALLLAAKRKYHLSISLGSVDDYRRAFREHGVELDKFNGDKMFLGAGIIDPMKLVEWLKT
jgi:subtilisin family serine protease